MTKLVSVLNIDVSEIMFLQTVLFCGGLAKKDCGYNRNNANFMEFRLMIRMCVLSKFLCLHGL